MIEIKNKILLITGGTGSFGNAVLNRFLNTDHFKEIRIFSRDEKNKMIKEDVCLIQKLNFILVMFEIRCQ